MNFWIVLLQLVKYLKKKRITADLLWLLSSGVWQHRGKPGLSDQLRRHAGNEQHSQ
jgi:hypothetical protein